MIRLCSAGAFLGLLATACGGGEGHDSKDAAIDGPPHVHVRDAGPLPDAAPVLCEAGTCSAASTTPLGESPCCLENGGCGLTSRALSSPVCLDPDEAGGVSLECSGLSLPGAPTLQGCCTPSGTCGVYDRFGGFGCIPEERFGSEPSPCEPDQSECRAIAEIPCDGPEDCAGGETCCGRLQSDIYDRFGCFPSCSTIPEDQGGIWFQICHSDEECPKSTERCTADSALPSFLGRCYATGDSVQVSPPAPASVSCGDIACAVGEKCCVRDPGTPYCAALPERCTCLARTSNDAGVTSHDAGSASRDASADVGND